MKTLTKEQQMAQLTLPDVVFPAHGQPYFADDVLLEQIAASHQKRMRVLQWSIGGPIVAAIVAILALWLLSKPAHAEPFYCKMLAQQPRNCVSVRRIERTFGTVRAERMARKCGATDADIAEAQTCNQKKEASPP